MFVAEAEGDRAGNSIWLGFASPCHTPTRDWQCTSRRVGLDYKTVSRGDQRSPIAKRRVQDQSWTEGVIDACTGGSPASANPSDAACVPRRTIFVLLAAGVHRIQANLHRTYIYIQAMRQSGSPRQGR